jgi:hypothetical protein
MDLNNFIKGSQGLTRNPLGIIALFISLIYGFSCLVLGTTGLNFPSKERILLILFIIIFPPLILFAFLYLVIKHHKKLYAPGDYKDERNFLEAARNTSYFAKIKREYIENTSLIDVPHITHSINELPKNNLRSVEKENITNEYNYSKFLNTYLLVQNLAINYIEHNYKSTVQRNIRFKDIPDYLFDGVILENNRVIGIEIKYFKENTISQSTIDSLIGATSKFSFQARIDESDKKYQLILFFIHELKDVDDLLKQIKELNKKLKDNFKNIDLEIKHINLKTLYEYAGLLNLTETIEASADNTGE